MHYDFNKCSISIHLLRPKGNKGHPSLQISLRAPGLRRLEVKRYLHLSTLTSSSKLSTLNYFSEFRLHRIEQPLRWCLQTKT